MSGSEADFSFAGGTVRAALRTEAGPVIAGGPCWLTFTVTVEDTSGQLFIAVGTDPQTGRPAGPELTATLDAPLDDVATNAPAMVGPSGAVPVDQTQPYEQRLLLNDFVRLEQAVERLAPGEEQELQIGFRRPFPLAADFPTALTNPGGEEVSLLTTVPVRRDDDALQAAIDDLAGVLRRNWRDATSNEVEDALRALRALRIPQALEALAALGDHPLALVREAAIRAGSAAG